MYLCFTPSCGDQAGHLQCSKSRLVLHGDMFIDLDTDRPTAWIKGECGAPMSSSCSARTAAVMALLRGDPILQVDVEPAYLQPPILTKFPKAHGTVGERGKALPTQVLELLLWIVGFCCGSKLAPEPQPKPPVFLAD